MSSGNYIITMTTGVIKKLKIIKTSKGYELKLYPILNDLKWEHHSCHGIVKSPNGIIWGVLIHPCKMTDHLTLRSPIQMVFCTESNFDPGSSLRNNSTMQLLNSWECVEILRCQSAKNNTLPCSWLAKIEKFDNLSLYELRLFMWISVICETFVKKKSKCRKLKSTLPLESDLKQILYFKYRINRIKYLFIKFETKNFSEFDFNSLYLLYDAVLSFKNDESYSEYLGENSRNEIENIKKKYEKITIESIPKCIWCEDNLSSKECRESHPDQRCCISGVQIPGIAKWECNLCGVVAHELLEDEDLFCPLCDVPMTQII